MPALNRLMLATFLSFVSLSAFSEMREYIREYTYAVGDADSKVSSRQISMKEVKLELLSELGTYIDSRVEMKQGNRSKDEFKHEITALTAGFVKVEMLEERYDGVTYYLKAKLLADPDDIVKRINELGENNNKAKEQKALLMQSYEESEKLRKELAGLRKEIQQYQSDNAKQSKLIKKYQTGTKKLSVGDTYETAQDYYYARKGLSKDYEKAFKLYMSAAEKGHADAMGQLSNSYFRGTGVKKDYDEAVVWALKGIKNGSKVAHYSMANLYHMGWGVKIDDVKAMDHVKKAGSAAYDKLWNDYAIGLGYMSQKDYFNAITYFKIGEEKGYSKSISELAKIYLKGKGVKVDEAKALELFKRCAKESLYCQNEVGRAYELGRGVVKNLQKAREAYEKAAKRDSGYGQLQLARFYEFGRGGAKDLKKAKEYYSAAKKNGKKADTQLARVEKKLKN